MRGKGKDALGRETEKKGEKNPEKKPHYPGRELEALRLGISESEELSPSGKEDLDEESARCKESEAACYHPEEQPPLQTKESMSREQHSLSPAPSPNECIHPIFCI